MKKVEYTAGNIAKCQCTSCPVQAKSECFKGKVRKMQEMMSEDVDIASMIEPEDVPGLYCSTGKASCTDLDAHQICKCGECPLWTEYGLNKGAPGSYFCRDGTAR
jgi:hypothetical protein